MSPEEILAKVKSGAGATDDFLKKIITDCDDFIKSQSNDLNKKIQTALTATAEEPINALQNRVAKLPIDGVKKSMASNPIKNAVSDFAAQIGTTIVQKITTEAFKKIDYNELAKVTDITQNIFQATAYLTSLGPEFAMEMARISGKKAIKHLNDKDKIAREMIKQVRIIHFSCMSFIGNSGFIEDYLEKLVAAHGELSEADILFARVANNLNLGEDSVFLARTFDSGISRLEAAQSLMLPDRNTGPIPKNLDPMRNLDDLKRLTDPYVQNVLQSKAEHFSSIGQAVSLALINLGKLFIDYVKAVSAANASLLAFTSALGVYINSYKKPGSLYEAALNHLQSGRLQLKDLLEDMDAALFLSPEEANSPIKNSGKVMALSTAWGIKNEAIIQWMKLNPGRKSFDEIDMTTASIAAYSRARDYINNAPDIDYSGGVFSTKESREAADAVTKVMSKLLFTVTRILARTITLENVSKFSVSAQFRNYENYLNTSIQHSSRTIAAITPFINTKVSAREDIARGISEIASLSEQAGLDRLLAIVNNGDMESLLTMSTSEMTSDGAAVIAISNLIVVAKEEPFITDQDIEKLELARNEIEATKIAKDIEMSRDQGTGSEALRQYAIAAYNKTNETIKKAVEVAKSLTTGESVTRRELESEDMVRGQIPGYNEMEGSSKLPGTLDAGNDFGATGGTVTL